MLKLMFLSKSFETRPSSVFNGFINLEIINGNWVYDLWIKYKHFFTNLLIRSLIYRSYSKFSCVVIDLWHSIPVVKFVSISNLILKNSLIIGRANLIYVFQIVSSNTFFFLLFFKIRYDMFLFLSLTQQILTEPSLLSLPQILMKLQWLRYT